MCFDKQMKGKCFFAAIFCAYQLVAAVSSSHGLEAEGSPFRFQPTPDELPSQQYKILKGAVAKNEQHKVFWPVGKPTSQSAQAVSDAYTEVSFPNPFQDPSRCVRSTGVDRTWICDPDMFLQPSQQAILESKLLYLRDKTAHNCPNGKTFSYQVAVAIASDILAVADEPYQQAVDRMASRMLRLWGIGHKDCHDGILLLFVPNRNVASLAVREGVEKKYISASFPGYVQSQVTTTYTITGDVNSAVLKGVSLIENQLPAAATGVGWMGTIILIVLALYLFSVLVAYVVFDYILTKNYLDMHH